MSGNLRASDDERRATTDRLSEAAAQGRLSLEELSERTDAALVATHREQLDRLVEDLPPDAATPAAATVPARTGGTAAAPVRETSLFGDVERGGAWPVPGMAAWRTWFGDVRLDLRRARLSARETTLDVSTVFGDLEVTVPAGVLVDVRCRTVFGDVKQRSEHEPPPGCPTLVLTGRLVFGDVRVVDVPRREKWRERLGLPVRRD